MQPKTFWDAACDPIDFFSTRVLFDKGQDQLDSEHNTPRIPSLAKTKDWSKSRCLKLVMEQRALPREDKMQRAKTLEEIYLNPREIDIFTEEEATYNAHILRHRFETGNLNEDPKNADGHYLYEIDQKARRTIQVLSNFLLLSKNAHKDVLDLLRDENLFIATQGMDGGLSKTSSSFQEYRDSIGVMTPTVKALHYQMRAPMDSIPENVPENEGQPLPMAVTGRDASPHRRSFYGQSSEQLMLDVDHNNVIKLLLRVRNLYQALSEVKSILQLIL